MSTPSTQTCWINSHGTAVLTYQHEDHGTLVSERPRIAVLRSDTAEDYRDEHERLVAAAKKNWPSIGMFEIGHLCAYLAVIVLVIHLAGAAALWVAGAAFVVPFIAASIWHRHRTLRLRAKWARLRSAELVHVNPGEGDWPWPEHEELLEALELVTPEAASAFAQLAAIDRRSDAEVALEQITVIAHKRFLRQRELEEEARCEKVRAELDCVLKHVPSEE